MSNSTHPINGLMDSSMQNLKSLVNADTIIGEAIHVQEGVTIIPVSKVTFGFASGGSDLPAKENQLFGGGAGGGVTVQPIAFLVIQDGHVELMQIQEGRTAAEKAINMVPDVVDKIAGLMKKEKTVKEQQSPAKEEPSIQ